MRYKVHYEDNTRVLDFELDSKYFIADKRINVDAYTKAKQLGGNPSYCKYLSIKKIESEDGNER